MKLELILSIIGVITGSLALAIDFFNYKFYLPKLIIKPLRNSYTINSKDIPNLAFNTTKIAVISVKISNSSAHPITIDEVYVVNSPKNKHYNDLKFKVPQIMISEEENSKTFTSLSPENIATIPLRIEPFDSQYVSFRLPFFNNTNPSFKLVLVTPRKNYSVKVKLLEYHELILSSRHKHQEE